MEKSEASEFWKLLNIGTLSMKQIAKNLPTFKRSETNFTLSMYDPFTRGERYYMTVLYLMARQLSEDAWEKIRNTKKRDTGCPIGITYKDQFLCLDYLQAVLELEFIEEHEELDGMDILEIGAGYGRTAHMILSNHQIKSYTIADLGNCLALSHRYLSEVLDKEHFAKITFIDVEEKFISADFDMCICIDAIAEMSSENIAQYLKYISEHCSWFYAKSPIGQYDVNIGFIDGERTLPLNEGFDRINILNNSEIRSQVSKFVANYLPGTDWECAGNKNALPFMHYWNAIYEKRTDNFRK